MSEVGIEQRRASAETMRLHQAAEAEAETRTEMEGTQLVVEEEAEEHPQSLPACWRSEQQYQEACWAVGVGSAWEMMRAEEPEEAGHY